MHLELWRSEGLEIYVVENIIPEFVVKLGLTKIWCKMQDVFNFKFFIKSIVNSEVENG